MIIILLCSGFIIFGLLVFSGYRFMNRTANAPAERVRMRRGLPLADTQDEVAPDLLQSKGDKRFRVSFVTIGLNSSVHAYLRGIDDTLARESIHTWERELFDGHYSEARLKEMVAAGVADVIEKRSDILLVSGSRAAQLAQEYSQNVPVHARPPIVFALTADPLRLGLVSAYSSSGNNLTGVALQGTQWITQMARLVHLALPELHTVLVPYSRRQLGGLMEEYYRVLAESLANERCKILSIEVDSAADVEALVIPRITREIDMLIILPDALILGAFESIAAAAMSNRVLILSAMNTSLIEKGVALTFGYSDYEVGVVAARQLIAVLEEGKHPSEVAINPIDTAQRFLINTALLESQGLSSMVDQSVLFLIENSSIV